jgi:hypothetical protein
MTLLLTRHGEDEPKDHAAADRRIRSSRDLAIGGKTRLDIKPATSGARSGKAALMISASLAMRAFRTLLAQEVHAPVGSGACISPERSVYNRGDP